MGIEHVVLWHQMGIMEPDWYEARAGSLVLQIYSNWEEDQWILLNASGLPEDAEPGDMPELYRHADLAEVKIWGMSWIASALHQDRDAGREHAGELVEALEDAGRKLSSYVGVCKGDKELTGSILPKIHAILAKIKEQDNG